MLSVSLVSLGGAHLHLGPSEIGIAEIRPSGRGQSSGERENLTVPWQNLQLKAPPFALMSWHGRLSDFGGRNLEIEELKEWAVSEQGVSVKFVTGCGGSGKSRFAAEFATLLQTQGWAAGFVDLRKPVAFVLKEAGTLLVVDYPEESPHETGELLRDLAGLGQDARFRVLFLTRRTISHWENTIHDNRAAVLVDPAAIDLSLVSPPDAYDLFCSAQDRTAELWNTVPLPLSKEAFTHWLGLKEEHKQPLFVLAAAIQGALHPEEEAVRYTGKEIVRSLAEREFARLRATAEKAGFQDQCALARLLVAAAIIGQISQPYMNALVQEGILGPDVSQGTALNVKLHRAGVMSESRVDAPKPDIVAAAFSSVVLANDPVNAPDFLWLALQNDIPSGLQRLARLAYDAEVVLAIREHKISKWLAEAVNNHPARCTALQDFLEQTLPVGLTEAAIAVWRTLLTLEPTNEERARLLNNLSTHLSESGDPPGALQASQEAVEIRRRLAKANPTRYEPDLAISLNNFSADLSESGDPPGALQAIQEAVEIRRRLAKANPARYEPDLATSLNNFSADLSESGDPPGALQAIQEAVEIRRRLAKANPARYEPDLATSLNNFSADLSESGDPPGALQAIQEAVEIRRHLAKANPARYEPDLATSLNNLTFLQREDGHTAGGKSNL